MSARASFAVAALLGWAGAVGCGCASIPQGRAAVDSVRIVNPGSLDARDVSDKLATSASPKFLGLFRGVVYDYEIFDESTLQRDLARLERYYRGQGFLEAHARAARVVHVSDDHVRVEITVDQGPPTLNRGITVNGLDGLPAAIAADVRAAATKALPPDARFDENAYQDAKTALQRALTDRGYAYATVQADAQADLATHAIDYTFSVKPGPPAVLGTITIVGLDPDGKDGPRPQEIDEAPLRRSMKLDPGDPYSTTAIEAATQALLDLEVFSAVQIVPDLPDPPAGVVPLTVKVEPTKLRVLQLGGGFEFDEIKTELHTLVGWEDHNFLGGLRDFSAELKPGVVLYPTRVAPKILAPTSLLPEERARLQFRQPGFLESRTSLYVRPEFNVYPLLVEANPPPDQPVVGYIEPKGAVGLERRFGKHFITSLGQNLQGEIPFAYTTPLSQPLPSILLSYPQLTTTFDLRDSPVHPHSGVLLSNDLQVAGVGGNGADVRIQPEVRGYVPLARGVTFFARGSLGFLFPLNYGDYVQNHLSQPEAAPTPAAAERLSNAIDRDIEIAYFRGFFSGGPNSNRGYPLRGIAPYGAVPFLNPATAQSQVANGCQPNGPNVGSSKCDSPIGGFTLWEASMEVRFEVSGPLGVALFCDAGDVSPHTTDLRFDHLHLSCGVGLRYDTPVGPVRLDIGYRIQPLQVLPYGNEREAWQSDHTLGRPPTLFGHADGYGGIPAAISFGIGEP